MPRAYFPLRSVVFPPELILSNGVSVATRSRVQPDDYDDLDELFSGRERRELREWHLALFYEGFGKPGLIEAASDAHYRLAEANLALQVVAPVGNFLAISLEEDEPRLFAEYGESRVRRLRVSTHHERYYGTTWSRMSGYAGMTGERATKIADGVLQMLKSSHARVVNPLRMYEQGLISTSPYLRVFLWTSALDGILMSSNPTKFKDRLFNLLGQHSLVFPPEDGVFFERPTTVADVATDIYTLRSEVAHGSAISSKFGLQQEDMRPLLPLVAYVSQTPRYFQLLEESTMALLRRVLHKIIEQDLLKTFADTGAWRIRLSAHP